MLSHFLIATWAKVCQALGEEFEPYLPVVMPPLLRVASSKADISIYGAYLAPLPARRSDSEAKMTKRSTKTATAGRASASTADKSA